MSVGPKFDIKSLYEKRIVRDNARLKSYNLILKIVYNNIDYIAKTTPHIQDCVFVVPEFFAGILIENVEDASEYLILRLNASGLNVIYTRPNLLHISWHKHEEQYNRDMNPFASVYGETCMVEPSTSSEPPTAPTKGKVPTARKVEDYVPAKSFY